MTTVSQMIEDEELPNPTTGGTAKYHGGKGNSPELEPGEIIDDVPEKKPVKTGESSKNVSKERKVSFGTAEEDMINEAEENADRTKTEMYMKNNDEIGGNPRALPRQSRERKRSELSAEEKSQAEDTKGSKMAKTDPKGAKPGPIKTARNEPRRTRLISSEEIKPAASTSAKSRRKMSESVTSPTRSNPLASPTRSKSLTSPTLVKRSRNSSSSDGSAKAAAADKRTKSADNNDVEEEIRKKSVALLVKALGTHERAEELAKAIEDAVYTEFKDANDHRYRSRVRSRIANLTRNPAIGHQLFNGKIKAERFAKMTPDELATRELKELREELETNIEDHLLPEREVVGTENTKRSDNAV